MSEVINKSLYEKLIKACREEYDYEKIQEIISLGVDVNLEVVDHLNFSFRFPPIHYALKSGNICALMCLLKNGANVNATDKFQQTCLHVLNSTYRFAGHRYPPINNSYKMYEILYEHGADVNLQDDRGNTPLHYESRLPVLELLINRGADVNIRNEEGHTPLALILDESRYIEILPMRHFERTYWMLDVIKTLLKAGAKV